MTPAGPVVPDANPQRSMLAQLLMNIFNGGQPFQNIHQGGAGNPPTGAGMPEMAGAFPPTPGGGAPLDMTVAGPWGAGQPVSLPNQAPRPTQPQRMPTPTPKPSQRRNRGEY